MNDKSTLGPYINIRDLEELPLERKEKYLKERLEGRIDKIQNEFHEMFCSGKDYYMDIVNKFNEYSDESPEIRDGISKNKKIIEIMEDVLYILASERHSFVSEIKEINRSIEAVFKSDFSRDPWKRKFFDYLSNNAIYIDQVDPLIEFFKKLKIPEKEYAIVLGKSLNKAEALSGGFSIEALMIKKKHGIKIEQEKLEKLKALADQALMHLMLPRAVEVYEALTELGCGLGAERKSIVSIYRSGRNDSEKKEMIKNIGIELNIIPKPKEPEKAEINKTKDAGVKEKDPWWKLW